MKLKSNKNITYSCKYHVIWCPKYRRKVLVGRVAERFEELLLEAALAKGVDLIEYETMPDHVHLLVEVDPQYGVHKFVKYVKGITSRYLRREFHFLTTKLPTLWTNAYFISTVGGAPLKLVKKYIENQKRSQRE
jgi:putative transposase